MDDDDSVSKQEAAIPLRSIHQRAPIHQRHIVESTSSMNHKSSRSLLNTSTRKKTGSRGKLRDSDEEAAHRSSLRKGLSNGNGRAALLGEGEQEGEYDIGWKNERERRREHDREQQDEQEDEEEQALLLEEGRVLVGCYRILYFDCL